MARGRTDAIIAGVNKAGTTSLFVSLSTHPDVAPSSIKETRLLPPARYGSRCRRPPSGTRTSPTPATGPCTSKPRRRTSTVARASPRRCATRLVDPHALVVVLREPVSRAISFFTYQKVRLRFPADYPITDYLAAADRLTADRLPRPREREVHGVPRRLLRRLPPRLARRARHRSRARRRLRPARRRPGRPRCTRPPRGSASTPRASPPTRSAPRTARPGTRARASSASRSPATTSSSACCAVTPSVKRKLRAVLLPAQRPSRRGAHPRRGARRARRRATRSPTRGSLSSSTTPGSPLPGWLVAFHLRPFRRHRRRIVARTSTPVRDVGVSATNTSAHSNTSAITAGIATPESLSA